MPVGGKATSLAPCALAVACLFTLLVAPGDAKVSGEDAAPRIRVEGVDFPPFVHIDGVDLALRGAALLRYKLFLKAYVAALYVEPEAAGGVPGQGVGRRLEIEYFWSIAAADFARATREGISRNVVPSEYDRLSPRIELLGSLYRDVSPGDRYTLTYLPGAGTELGLNGEALGIVEGEDFADALFAIWLGRHPLDETLKEELLGDS